MSRKDEPFFSRLEPGGRLELLTIFRGSLLALALLAADQLSKAFIVKHVAFGSRHAVIPHFFNITRIANPGAAWGSLSEYGWLLMLISFLALAGILVFLKRLSEGWPERYYALLLVASGIVGNSSDRIFRGGKVVDFLQFYLGRFEWPSFNVADSCITVGVAVFIISSIFRPEDGQGDGRNGILFKSK